MRLKARGVRAHTRPGARGDRVGTRLRPRGVRVHMRPGGAGRQGAYEDGGAGRQDQGQNSDDTNPEGEGAGGRVWTMPGAWGGRVCTRSMAAGGGRPVTPAAAQAAAGVVPASRTPWRRGGCRCKKATGSETMTMTLPLQPTMRATVKMELSMTKMVIRQRNQDQASKQG